MKTLQLSENEITTMCIFLSHHRAVSGELRSEADELIRNLLAQTTQDAKKYHELVEFYDAAEKPSSSLGM